MATPAPLGQDPYAPSPSAPPVPPGPLGLPGPPDPPPALTVPPVPPGNPMAQLIANFTRTLLSKVPILNFQGKLNEDHLTFCKKALDYMVDA